MKKIILNFEKILENFKELVQEAFNKDILNFMVSKASYQKFENIERVKIYSRDPDIPCEYMIYDDELKLDKKITENKRREYSLGLYKEIISKTDEKTIIDLSKTKQIDLIMVSAKNWKIIPFENLIAEMHTNDTELIAVVEDVSEAETLLKTLEMGVDGILITPHDVNDIVDLKKLIQTTSHLELIKAKIINIQNLPESDRVCVDTTSLLHTGEGMLVGSTAKGFVLIHAEVFETPFVASRPFRVNAGDVSAYILVPDEDPEKIYRTSYLSELKGGDKVLVVNTKGETREVSVGRVKVETRPMLRFELEVPIEKQIIKISGIYQNAETIRLVDGEGNAKSVVDIKIGDEVLIHIGPGATHFGTAIKETIIER